ncbi:MAG: ATP-binding protein [Candidatus Micrarchaeales archaeon]
MALCNYVVESLPNEEEWHSLVSSFAGSELILVNDFSNAKTSIVTEDENLCTRIRNAMPGFDFSEGNAINIENPQALVTFSSDTEPFLNDVCRMLEGENARLFIFFGKTDRKKLHLIKNRVEEELSSREIRMTKGSGSRSATQSTQADIFYNSDERRTMLGMLNMFNDISSLNGSSYRILLIIDGNKKKLQEYLKSRLLILELIPLKCGDMDSLYRAAREIESLPFSHKVASQFIVFSDQIPRRTRIYAQVPMQMSGGIEIGSFLKDSISKSDSTMRIEKSTLNLGAIMTGLPGTGKTFAAMSLLSKLNSGREQTSVVIISPTKEWADFAQSQHLHLIRIYGSNIPINFFRCAYEEQRDKFAENLAMLVASASNAGPYQNSLEKCLLAAFRRVYGRELCPDPVSLYDQIEETIIEQHAKRSATGVKYTKHGENIRAALENLRQMLFRPEFASTSGIDLIEAFRRGVVFDLSAVSNNMKQFFYALILNQLYSFIDSLDENGNDALRLEIALEEAQLIFPQNEISPSVLDLKQRIQDFRKKGIGMLLITHSITDVTPSIRRLCQTKFYFRQSSDVTRYALIDLGIEEEIEATNRIRALEQGCCAVLYLDERNGEKIPKVPAFVKISSYAKKERRPSPEIEFPKGNFMCNCNITVIDSSGNPSKGRNVELFYLNQVVARGFTNEKGIFYVPGMIRGKEYEVAILGEKKKDTVKRRLAMSESIAVRL